MEGIAGEKEVVRVGLGGVGAEGDVSTLFDECKDLWSVSLSRSYGLSF